MSNKTMIASETTILRRINRALADSGLRVRTARRGSPAAGSLGRHYLVYGARAFCLRVGIDELARSLGILNPIETAETGLSPIFGDVVLRR
jgi:hypothetical protein